MRSVLLYLQSLLQDIYELKTKRGERSVEKVAEHDTDVYPVMNAAVVADGKNYRLAVGLDQFCQLYTLKYRIVTPKKEGEGSCLSAQMELFEWQIYIHFLIHLDLLGMYSNNL